MNNKYIISILDSDKIMQIFCIADDFCKELEGAALEMKLLFW